MHIYHAVSIFMMFVLAQLVHAWERASDAVNSKANGIVSYDQYVHLRSSEIMSRFLLVSCIFGGWVSGGLYGLIGYIAPDTGASLASHPIAVTWWTAGLLGYFGDSVLYFFVGLIARIWPEVRQDVPPTISSTVEKAA
jgi:hypothetical protein